MSATNFFTATMRSHGPMAERDSPAALATFTVTAPARSRLTSKPAPRAVGLRPSHDRQVRLAQPRLPALGDRPLHPIDLHGLRRPFPHDIGPAPLRGRRLRRNPTP